MLTSFILPPYWQCPRCHTKEFGVFSIDGNRYTRACKNCEYSHSYSLPEIKEKIIYLDQYALSKMFFKLNPRINKASKVNNTWLELFKILDELCKLNLIVCPDSGYQRHESIVTPWFKDLKRLYELLSNGATFKTDSEIKEEQIYVYAKAWIECDANPKLDIKDVIRGDLFGWKSRIKITVDWTESEDAIKQLRDSRKEIEKSLNNIFEQWKTEKDVSIEDRYQKEIESYGWNALEEYNKYAVNHIKFANGDINIDFKSIIFQPPTIRIVQTAMRAFQNCGISDSDIPIRTFEYFTSEDIKMVPFLNTSCWLLAALSRNAQNGQKSVNQGMANDINAIANLSPYCDAMLVDNPSRELIKQVQNNITASECTFYSENNLPDFMNYLDEIKRNADPEYLAKVSEVYGENWGKPFLTLFE